MKWRFFRHLLGGNDPDAERAYRWHLEARKVGNAAIGLGMDGKSGTDQYVRDAEALISSITHNGFLLQGAVPVDPDGELLGGAHRVACALALGYGDIPIVRRSERIWAPPWGEQWFRDNGLGEPDFVRLRQDYERLTS